MRQTQGEGRYDVKRLAPWFFFFSKLQL